MSHSAFELHLPSTDTPQRERPLVIVGVVVSIAVLVIAATAKVPTYHVNPVFLIPLAWIPYYFRRGLHLTFWPYLLFGLAILFHDMGAYGCYQHSPFPFSFDIAVHFYFAIPVVVILYIALAGHFPMLRPLHLTVTAGLFMMGIGALHEIMEYMSYLLLGEEKGMLKPSTAYFFDTQRDLTNNLLGTITALLIIAIFTSPSVRRRGPAPRSPAP
jgi:uncharacterized membrane protein YjdF